LKTTSHVINVSHNFCQFSLKLDTAGKMENLHSLETPVLMEMLIKQTAELTAKIADRNPRGVDQYKYELALIQAELNSRNQRTDNTTISDPGIGFSSPSAHTSGLIDSGSVSTTE
jgi:hypothetical protein